MVFEDPVLIVIVIFVALVIFAFYLMFRRTVLAFREGMDRK